MKKILVLLSILVIGCSPNQENSNTSPSFNFYHGMDLSFLPESESIGLVLKDENGEDINDHYEYLSDRGVNLMRIRIWVNNPDGRYNVAFAKAQARIAQQKNMHFLLDFHYSETWADPGKQFTPQVWEQQNVIELAESVKNYSFHVVNELVQQGTPPHIVQIGNETNNGMLWPVGKIYTSNGEDWSNYIKLTKAGITGVKMASPDTQIMIHKADPEGANYFFNQLDQGQVQYDIIGLSYYPWWSNLTIDQTEDSLQQLAMQHDQKIMLVETAYPFSLGWVDDLNNIVGLPEQVAPMYPATPNGQRAFLWRMRDIMKNLPDEKGLGFCYWAPDWVAFENINQAQIPGSNWENVTLFDFNLRPTPALEVYGVKD